MSRAAITNTYPPTDAKASDEYLADGYDRVVGMSSRFAAAVCGRLLKLQSSLGVEGHFAEIGAFEGRFLIAMAHALEPGERAVGMDIFEWPNAEVKDRFEANCSRHGLSRDRVVTWKVDSGSATAAEVTAKAGGPIRMFHVDGEHSRAALTKDLELATASIAPGGLIVLDDMLHPGYPTLMVAVQAYLERHPEMTVLAVIDRETIVAATKFVLCRKEWFKRYEERMLEIFQPWIWPMGADFEPHWCLVLSLDTRLAAIT
ncbi:MAG: class I SAM-dependent methyltransferase [Proteobacteria bacterium]|nr:class I SAM-dependent methyltransferase [Pseudomonadota bacterium]